jgi:hypothetical protein
MMSLLGSAFAGLSTAETSAGRAATDLSRISVPRSSTNVVGDFVTMSVSTNQVGVSAKLAETAEQDDKTLLDIVA